MELDKFFEETDFESALIEVNHKVDKQEVIPDDEGDCESCKI